MPMFLLLLTKKTQELSDRNRHARNNYFFSVSLLLLKLDGPQGPIFWGACTNAGNNCPILYISNMVKESINMISENTIAIKSPAMMPIMSAPSASEGGGLNASARL